jgi:hypothetical protein
MSAQASITKPLKNFTASFCRSRQGSLHFPAKLKDEAVTTWVRVAARYPSTLDWSHSASHAALQEGLSLFSDHARSSRADAAAESPLSNNLSFCGKTFAALF